MRSLIAFFSGICFLVATPTALAWNGPGHMTSAAIAYADLKDRNPAVLEKVIEILKQHPQYESKWAPKLEQVSPRERDLYLLMFAATWPDDVRKKYPEYDRPAWHYVNIPYHPGKAGVTIPKGESIISAYLENLSIVKSSHADNEARAVALCWLLHLIGDVHQPLHTVKLVTEQFPEGDRGGTRFYVLAPSGKTIGLHRFWDGLILGSKRPQEAGKEAVKLRKKPYLKRENFADRLAVKRFDDWAVEGHDIAIEQVYRRGTLQGSTEKDNGAALPNDYINKVKEVAERQIMLTGYRISDTMVDLLGR